MMSADEIEVQQQQQQLNPTAVVTWRKNSKIINFGSSRGGQQQQQSDVSVRKGPFSSHGGFKQGIVIVFICILLMLVGFMAIHMNMNARFAELEAKLKGAADMGKTEDIANKLHEEIKAYLNKGNDHHKSMENNNKIGNKERSKVTEVITQQSNPGEEDNITKRMDALKEEIGRLQQEFEAYQNNVNFTMQSAQMELSETVAGAKREMSDSLVSFRENEERTTTATNWTKVMVVGGTATTGKFFEVINLLNDQQQWNGLSIFPQTKSCSNIYVRHDGGSPFWYLNCEIRENLETFFGGVGTIIGERPFVCGGTFNRTCFRYEDFAWKKSLFGFSRISPTAVWMDQDRWWVLGGQDSGNKPNTTTEIYSFSSGFKRYVDLPREGKANCIKKMNDTHYILLGGEDRDRRIWVFDMATELWTNDGISPPGYGEGAHCGIIRNMKGEKEMVVTTIWGDRKSFIISLKDLTWRDGPEMPYDIIHGAVVEMERTFLIVGGLKEYEKTGVKDILKFDPDTEKWVMMKQALQVPRYKAVALLVPDTALEF